MTKKQRILSWLMVIVPVIIVVIKAIMAGYFKEVFIVALFLSTAIGFAMILYEFWNRD